MAKAAKKTAKKASAKKTPAALGYKGHRVGTLKEKLHMLFDKHGPEKARPHALKLNVEPSTVTTSFSQFRKLDGTSKPRKPAAKKSARKAPAKKAAKKASARKAPAKKAA
jgi:DNA-binding protein HU-beta